MKVKIGNYPSRMVSSIYTDYMNAKYGWYDWNEDNLTLFEKFLEKLEDGLQFVYNSTINRFYFDESEQYVDVRIDPWDTWSMNYTLAHIIIPMLKQLKETKHGAPFVEQEDVPEHLRAPKDFDSASGDVDDNFFKRWDYVLDEMIFAFESELEDEIDFTVSDKKRKRMDEGRRLFAKYYQSLWD